jgi:hypothetical protein
MSRIRRKNKKTAEAKIMTEYRASPDRYSGALAPGFRPSEQPVIFDSSQVDQFTSNQSIKKPQFRQKVSLK